MSFYTSSGGPPVSETMYNGGSQLGKDLSVGTADNYGLSIITNGIAAITVDTSQNVTFAGSITPTGVFIAPAGTAAAPGYAFVGELDCGMYKAGTNSIAFSTAGSVALTFGSAQIATFAAQLLGASGTVSLPGLSFSAEPDCGLYVVGTNSIAVATNGTVALTFSSAQAAEFAGAVSCATTLGVTGIASFAAGAVGTPSVAFTGDPNTGLYSASADVLGVAAGGVLGLSVSATVVTVGPAANVGTHLIHGNATMDFPTAAADAILIVSHTDNTSGASNSVIRSKVAGASGGDAIVDFLVTGAQGWAMGIDNSASDAFVIAASQALGTNNAISISTAGAVSVPGTLEVTGVTNLSTAGFRTKVSTANVTAPPTNAEMVSAFGAAATVGAGFIALVDDNNGHADEFIVWSDGTKYWYATGTACA